MSVRPVECKRAISPSRLPGLDWALNPYRGCSHGCRYCYVQDVTRFALGRSWGDEVEARTNIASRLRKELGSGARGVYGLGTVTDPYQPAEETFKLTRACLLVLKDRGASVSVLTKSPLVLRDIDVLMSMKRVEIGVSVGCVDDAVSARLEPGAPPPSRRISALSELVANSIDAYLMAAPVVPGISDSEEMLVNLVQKAHDAGVRRAIWDKFNSKPIALKRMKDAFPGMSFGPAGESSRRIAATRRILGRECSRLGIALSDAF